MRVLHREMKPIPAQVSVWAFALLDQRREKIESSAEALLASHRLTSFPPVKKVVIQHRAGNRAGKVATHGMFHPSEIRTRNFGKLNF
jgi:hypothetical protein